jgi:hypothetical protein
MTKRQRIGPCTYCGKLKKLSVDHVPPKSLFPKPRPGNLITVPACRDCNEGESTHDEYFATALALNSDLTPTPALDAVRAKVERAMAMPEKAGFSAAFRPIQEVSRLYHPNGRPLAPRSTYDVKVERLARVVSRTTAGLFFRFNGRLLRSGYLVGAQLESELRLGDDPGMWRQVKDVQELSPLLSYPGVYSVRGLRSSTDPDTTVWWHTFYDKVSFLGATIPPADDQASSDAAV